MQFLCDRPLLLRPDFQLLDRQVVNTVLNFRSSRPFLRGVVAWVGFPVMRLEFVADARNSGTPSYSLRKMISLGLDGITALSTRPLRLATYLGLISAGLCLCYSAFILFS
jgi:dolichol-phosphate mannosyltransferase